MKKEFFLFRHGETEFNRLGLRQGQGINIGLNETGIRQAVNLAHSLLKKNIEIIYSSPLIRAVETAEIVAGHLKVPIRIIDELTEGNFGKAEGLHRKVVQSRWPEVLAHWYTIERDDCRFPGGESKFEIRCRMQKALEQMLRTEERIIAVSSHGSALRFLLMAMGGDGSKLPNAVAVHVVWENGIWQIK